MSAEGRLEWNEGQEARLRELFEAGLSFAQIARAIGGHTTRSAMIGKARRLGLHRDEPDHKPLEEPKPRRLGSKIDQVAKTPPLSPESPPLESRPTTAVDAPAACSGAVVTLETVSSGTCRWPIGDPHEQDFHFCGLQPKHGKPYCEAHCRQAYTPASLRPVRPDDGQSAANRRHPMRRGQLSMWE